MDTPKGANYLELIAMAKEQNREIKWYKVRCGASPRIIVGITRPTENYYTLGRKGKPRNRYLNYFEAWGRLRLVEYQRANKKD